MNESSRSSKKQTLEKLKVYAEDVALTKQNINRAAVRYFADFHRPRWIRLLTTYYKLLVAWLRKMYRKTTRFINSR